MALPTLRPLGFGEILDGAFTLYRRNFVTFIVTALIPTAALLVGFVLLGGGMITAMNSAATGAGSEDVGALVGAAFGGMMLVGLLAMVGVMVMWGALTREASQAYTGQPTSVGDGFAAGLRAFFPMLLSGILAFIGIVVAVFAIAFLIGIVVAVFASMGGAMAALGMVLGVLVWIGVLAGAASLLFALVPAIVVERAGPIEALERSFTLARGALGRVLGLMLVTMLITYLPSLAVMAVTGGFAQFTNPGTLPTPGQFWAQQVMGWGASVLTTPFMVSVIVLLYFDRRVRTEALDVQMMTERLAVAGN